MTMREGRARMCEGAREYIFAFFQRRFTRKKGREGGEEGGRGAIEDAGGQKHALPKSTDFEESSLNLTCVTL